MAMILEPFVAKLLDMVFALVKDEVDMFLGVPDEIQKLGCTLSDIRSVLAHAEEKRMGAEQIDKWILDLKDVMYDADDILDELKFAAADEKCSEVQPGKKPRSSPPLYTSSSSSSLPSSSSSSSPLYGPYPSSHFRNTVSINEIGQQIRSLNRRLDEISARKSRLNLYTLPLRREDTRASGLSSGMISKHTSYLMEPDIVGTRIDEDTQVVVEWLTREDPNQQPLLVYGITGMGGIGKTTLAQKIYNDQRIISHFSTNRMWVCVSQDFGEDKLLKDIISSAGGDYGRAECRTLLEPILERSVRGKKFLLVLDDVWDAKVWGDLLRKPLWSGGFGSRILVTTRNEEVANRMKAVDTLTVGLLPPEDGWALLRRVVVLPLPEQEREIEDLKDIGMAIIKKCGRLPLAIKVVGGAILCKKKRPTVRSAWMEVLSSSAWSVTGLPRGIHEALYLSYEALPPHLKQCFLLCSLFPEDYEIHKESLVRLWIAEGFVKAEGRSSALMEDLGEDYYWELVSRNLLQPLHGRHQKERCRMHDLVRSLSQFLTRDEGMVVTKEAQGLIGEGTNLTKPRHLSIIREHAGIVNIPDGFGSLRTVLMFRDYRSTHVFDWVDTFEKIRRLRVLDLSDSPSITRLPHSVGNLVHLRYINLAYAEISFIPESIGNLKNLQFLILRHCSSLRCLPKGVENLQELRCLDVRFTLLDGIPVGVGRMRQLNTLCGFRLHPNSSSEGWCTLEELRPLTQLRELTIENLEYASSCSPRKGRGEGGVLVDKPNLRSIELGSTYVANDDDEVKRLEEVFEKLCPPSCVETLSFYGYYGRRFPIWMTISVLSNLTQLTLCICPYCEQLPPLGLLPHLDYLRIEDADAVVSIGREFLCNSGGGGGGGATTAIHPSSFPKLKKLEMKGMVNWEEWQWEEGEVAMPLLEYLGLYHCPKLRSLPRGLLRHATALTSLHISAADSLRAVENLRSLRRLRLTKNPKVESISGLPALLELEVEDCLRLREVYNLGNAMRVVKLLDTEMESLPDWLISDRRIEIAESGELHITCSDKLCAIIRLQGEQAGIQHTRGGNDREIVFHRPYHLDIRKPRTIYVSKPPSI